MDWAHAFALAEQAWAQAKTFIIGNPGIAGAALLIAAVVIALMILRFFRFGVRGMGSLRRAARTVRVLRSSDMGPRILIGRGRTLRERAVCRFMHQSLERHLKEFMFGGPYSVLSYPDEVGSDERAQALMARTESDLIIWAQTPKDAPKDTLGAACFTSRARTPTEPVEGTQVLLMPRSKADWTPALSRGMAYAAAKQYRPALGRPQDFRPERLKPVVEILLSVLEGKPKADPQLLAELVDDASSGALQLAAAGEDEWLERAVDFTRSTLDGISRSAAPDRWIAAKVNLGRALRLRAERRFDPVVLREATAHLQEALEALRSESRFRLAESAAQAIADAQKLLSGRRKFSITGGGV